MLFRTCLITIIFTSFILIYYYMSTNWREKRQCFYVNDLKIVELEKGAGDSLCIMYIQHIHKKKIIGNYVFKAENLCGFGWILALEISIFLFLTKSDDYLDWYIRNLKNSRLKTFFSVQKNHLNLSVQEENSKWLCVLEKQVLS